MAISSVSATSALPVQNFAPLPPVTAPAPAATSNTTTSTSNDQSNQTPPASNAAVTSPANAAPVYSAIGDANASTIRGSGLDITA